MILTDAERNGQLPAYPEYSTDERDNPITTGGLTKREAFAMAAMQSMQLKDDGQYSDMDRTSGRINNHPRWVAAAAARYADALLLALTQEPRT